MAITKVEFYKDNTLIGSRTSAPFDSFTWTSGPPGIYSLTSKVFHDGIMSGVSEPINIEVAIATTNLFDYAVAYWKMNELTGQTLDSVNGHLGTPNGSMSRDGEWYSYGGLNAYVEFPDSDDFSFVDVNGNNTDFTIKTEFVVEGWNYKDRFWLVSKIEENQAGVSEWQLTYSDNSGLYFSIWDVNNNYHLINSTTSLNLNQEYMVDVSCINNVLYLRLDGVRVATYTLPAGFQFYNGTSVVQLGNSTRTTNLNLIGKQKETTIINGYGWTDADSAEVWNNGNPITI